MSSSGGHSSGSPKPADLFGDLWRQLRECHQNAVQELEAKVSKLKNERYLDAQSLEVFHLRTQHLKEQNKTLKDAVSCLEERLCAGECDRCTTLEENLKSNQIHNLHLIAKLENERDTLEDENRKLHAELQKLKMSCSDNQQTSSPKQEEGIIPDSPVLPSSLPVANKLRKPKDMNKMKHVRYAELPLPQSKSNKSLFSVLDKKLCDSVKNPGRAQVLVPNTCELETSQVSDDVDRNLEDTIAETCGLELIEKPLMAAAGQQRTLKSPWNCSFRLKPYHLSPLLTPHHSPDSTTERSPSLLPNFKRVLEHGSSNKAKRKKQECEPEVREEGKPTKEKEEECHGELADSDRTWVSHSLLQGQGKNVQDRRNSVSGLAEKANDTFDKMFDTTAYGECKSYNSSHFGQSQPCSGADNNEDDNSHDEEDDDPHENTMSQSNRNKARRPTFAHMAVVRKKDERRKLKGTTCKECEIYYAHLPEDEKQKKLSACSRHRFLYIPPCTPENFWEVGFPSTQTCIERGYIKEEKNPQAHTRRRRPLNALFSPKQQDS